MSRKVFCIYIGCSILVWAIFLSPALFSGWFPLDLPALVKIGSNFSDWFDWIVNPNTGSGRYVPVYWLFYALNYYIFGANFSLYFLFVTLLYISSAAIWGAVLLSLRRSVFWGVGLVVLIAVGSPVAESVYTLGKPEPLACFFVSLFLIVFFNGAFGVLRGAYRNFALVLLFLLSLWSKETSLALVGFAVTGVFVSLLVRRVRSEAGQLIFVDYLRLLGVLFIGALISRVPYYFFEKAGNDPSYVSYEVSWSLVRDNFLFYVAQQPDVFLFGLVSAFLLGYLFWRIYFWRVKCEGEDDRSVVFMISLCSLGWAFYLALLMWRWPMPYYMLFPALLFKVCAVYAGGKVLEGALRSLPKLVFYGMVFCATAYGMLSMYYVALSQVQYSLVYESALRSYVEKSGGSGRLMLESYPFYSEQVGGTGDVLEFLGGRESGVWGLADALDPAQVDKPDLLKLLGVTKADLDGNYKNFPSKGDYVLAFTGRKVGTWFLRGVAPYYQEESLLKKWNSYEMELVSEKELSAPAFFFSLWDSSPKIEETSVGYKLYRILGEEPRQVWRGLYPDGWGGKEVSLKVNSSFDSDVVAKISVPDFGLPNTISIFKDGILFKELDFRNTDEKTVVLAMYGDREHEFRFVARSTVSPFELGMNKDRRDLGFMLSLSQVSKIK
ncbi:hypothetical protein ACFONG_10015 [Uliginosibacterium paludis]|uniref:Glycosyltransferase RgtA/B/C/D-like domain-containing protein n=1 Tax=Uliginosibacterium paludis TaxID=1615952 RepID=A0ABV2CMQ7_9RHOO